MLRLKRTISRPGTFMVPVTKKISGRTSRRAPWGCAGAKVLVNADVIRFSGLGNPPEIRREWRRPHPGRQLVVAGPRARAAVHEHGEGDHLPRRRPERERTARCAGPSWRPRCWTVSRIHVATHVAGSLGRPHRGAPL